MCSRDSRLPVPRKVVKVENQLRELKALETHVLDDFVQFLNKVGEILREQPTVEAIFNNKFSLSLKAIFGETCMIETCVIIETGSILQPMISWNEKTDETKFWMMSWQETRLEKYRSRSIVAEDDLPGLAVLQLKKAFLTLDPAREDFRDATDALLRDAITAGIPDNITPQWQEYHMMKRTVMPSELDKLLKSIQQPDTELAQQNFEVGATLVETGIRLVFVTIYDESTEYGCSKCVMLERRFIGGAKDPVLSVYVEG